VRAATLPSPGAWVAFSVNDKDHEWHVRTDADAAVLLKRHTCKTAESITPRVPGRLPVEGEWLRDLAGDLLDQGLERATRSVLKLPCDHITDFQGSAAPAIALEIAPL
jgi:hypothetical protein